jgi:hypothetical protein
VARSGLGGDGSARLLRTLSSPVISARVRDLATLTAGAVVSTWGSWTSASPTQPTYQLGTDSKYEVQFDRTLGQFLDAGTKTFNIGTNAGFTIVTQFKFTGVIETNEPLFSMSNVVSTSEFLGLRRQVTSTALRFSLNIAGSSIVNFNMPNIEQDQWYVAAIRYIRIAGVGYVQGFRNGTKGTDLNIGATTIPDRTDTMTYIGKYTYNATNMFTGSMRFAAMWDRALTDNELTGLYTSLTS